MNALALLQHSFMLLLVFIIYLQLCNACGIIIATGGAGELLHNTPSGLDYQANLLVCGLNPSPDSNPINTQNDSASMSEFPSPTPLPLPSGGQHAVQR